jgi:hypothetical protein
MSQLLLHLERAEFFALPALGGTSSADQENLRGRRRVRVRLGLEALAEAMRHVAHDVRQCADDTGTDAEVLPRRALETNGSQQVPQHKANREGGQRDNNEPGEKRVEHLGVPALLNQKPPVWVRSIRSQNKIGSARL